MKVCARHQQAHREDEQCPYCEPTFESTLLKPDADGFARVAGCRPTTSCQHLFDDAVMFCRHCGIPEWMVVDMQPVDLRPLAPGYGANGGEPAITATAHHPLDWYELNGCD